MPSLIRQHPQQSPEDEQLTSRVLQISALLLSGIAVILVSANLSVEGEPGANFVTVIGWLLVTLLSYLFARYKRVTRAAGLLAGSMWFLAAISALFSPTGNILHISGFVGALIIVNLVWTSFTSWGILTAGGLVILVSSALHSEAFYPVITAHGELADWVSPFISYILFAGLIQIVFYYFHQAIAQQQMGFDELERQTKSLHDLAAISRDISSAPSLNNLVSEAAAFLQQRFTYRYVALLFYDESRKNLELYTSMGSKAFQTGGEHRDAEIVPEKLVDRCLSTHTAQIQSHPVDINDPRPTYVEVALPIQIGNLIAGILYIESAHTREIEEERMPSLALFSDQLANLIARLRDFELTQSRYKELQVVNALAQAGSEASSLQELITTATQIIGETLYPDNFGVLILDREEGYLHAHSSYRAHSGTTLTPVPLGKGITGRVASQGQAMRLSDISSTPEYVSLDPAIRSELCVPITVRGRIFGVINAESTRTDAFSEDDERHLSTFSRQLATAIERVLLLEETNRQITEQALLLEASRAVSTSLRIETVLHTVAQKVTAVIEADGCVISAWNIEQNRLVTLLDYSEKAFWEPAEPGTNQELDDFPTIAAVLTSRNPIVIQADDLHADPQKYDWMKARGIHSVLILPLQVRGRVSGLVEIISVTKERRFTSHEIGLVQTMANQLASAIENARLYSEAQRQARELSQALEALRELDRLKSEFIQNVSHELRTPLAIVRGYAELLENGDLGPLNQKQLNPIQIISRRVRILSNMVDDLIAILESEANQRKLEIINMNEFLDGLLIDFEPQFADSQLRLESQINEELPYIQADAAHIRRAFDNLFGNALKFTPVGGSVTIKARAEGEWVRIIVMDTGVGIPANQLDRIFERFYQVDGSTTRRYGGTGLGLALVKEILTAHGGQISVTSDLGTGSTFDIMLPVYTPRKTQESKQL